MAPSGEPAEPFLGIAGSIIAIIILIILSGFFAGSETALTGVSKSRMHALAKEKNKRAAMVNKIRERKDNMIGALMLGNTAVHVLASALAAGLLIHLFGEAGVLYASFVMTVLVLIFGEVLPKTYALHHADSVAMAIAPLIRAFIAIFAPITALITATVAFMLKMFGADKRMVSTTQHLESLRGAIDLHRGPGEETQEQRAMLRSILDLFDVGVEDIMIHRRNTLMINGNQPVRKIIEDVLESPYTRLPVWSVDPDNIIGILHVKLLLKELSESGGDPEKIHLDNVILEPWFIPETTNLFDQLQAFRERKEHFALVVDEYGTLKGIVTLEDILEEIVGEIDDEHDVTVPGVRRVKGGRYLVDGTVTIRDLNREYEWGLPDDHYSTLGGLLLYETRMIPEIGQSFTFFGFRFDVMRRHRNQITLVRITPPKKKERSAPPEHSAAGVRG
ncbi:MAG: HlyC/CorC family transporter [Alphaproteobacteria bacterium]|nr:HlyC/CorC family transporter [Alphaproteobacteria bacterium]